MSVDLSFDLYRLVYFLASAAVAIGAVDAAVTVAWRGAEYRLVVGGGTCSVGFDCGQHYGLWVLTSSGIKGFES